MLQADLARHLHLAGGKQPNALGFYDMKGNVAGCVQVRQLLPIGL
jgi:formylglycine-generating enzyme required for sulfatase activity